jgi:hypothetical protein
VYAKGVAVIYLLFAVMGLMPPAISTVFGLVPLHGHDVWLHLLLAAVAGYFGFIKPETDQQTAKYRPTSTTPSDSDLGAYDDSEDRPVTH